MRDPQQWDPKKEEELVGQYGLDGLTVFIETGGAQWTLPPEAEAQVKMIDPREGQMIHVWYRGPDLLGNQSYSALTED
jgi:hypothetical protein